MSASALPQRLTQLLEKSPLNRFGRIRMQVIGFWNGDWHVTLTLGREDTEWPLRVVEMPGSDTFSPEARVEIPKRLIDGLEQNKVHYDILHHAEAVTAQRIAQAEHVKGRHQAKVVILKSDDQHFMVALSADHHIDLQKIENAIGKPVSLGQENDFKSLFPDSMIGAMPPFGNLYGLPTYVDNIWPRKTTLCSKPGHILTR